MGSLKLDDQLCFSIYAAAHAFSRAYKPLLDELGITYPQYLVLLVLWDETGLTVSRVGDRLHLDSSTLTPLLKRLEAQGLVVRQRGSRDERQVYIRLTPAGIALKDKAVDIPRCITDATGATLPKLIKIKKEIDVLRTKLLATSEKPRSRGRR